MAQTEMRYKPLGRCGTKVSILSLGGWTTYGGTVTDDSLVKSIIKRAFDAGINFFDMADIYANGEAERFMGKAFKEFPRHNLVLSTKLYWPMSEDVNDRSLSRKHIMESVNRSLQRIGTDYIDIYFCHRFDEETPVEETARAMDDLIHQGKVLYWGTSEWTGAQLKEAHRLCRNYNLYPPQVEQPQYNLLNRSKFEKDVRPSAVKLGMGLVVWSPLASGILSGKYDQGIPEDSRLAHVDWLKERFIHNKEMFERVRIMRKLSQAMGCTRAQLALAWAAAQSGVSSVITGATRLEQLEENLGALSLKLPSDITRSLTKIFPS